MTEWTNSVLTGDVRERLGDLPDDSVHMVMTSPPYFGLRDYGHDDQIGLEDELDAYIEELVAVFREVRRVLRPDGSAWLNLGDSYSGGRGNHMGNKKGKVYEDDSEAYASVDNTATFGRKNKMLVPHRVAIALQSDGWVVRNDVTWVKPNPMPSSVKDRLNTTTEQIFHLTPNPDYWYDLDAIREAHCEKVREDLEKASDEERDAAIGSKGSAPDRNDSEGSGFNNNASCDPAGKNPGDVFEVTTKPFPDAHFAVYPPELCDKPLKATCPPTVCVECGSPYERNALPKPDETPDPTIPFKQTCDCDTDATEPGIALDPFAGAGTTLLKAKELGRRFVGVELNAEYADMARARIGLTPNDPATVRSDDDQQGFEAYTDGGDDAE